MAATNLIGLDIGERRIGIARVDTLVRIPQALQTSPNDSSFLATLKNLITEYDVSKVIVGLPRNLDGRETAQTAYVKNFCKDKLSCLNIPVAFQDETLSTVEAADRIRGSKTKVSIDAAAACIILEDYLNSEPQQ